MTTIQLDLRKAVQQWKRTLEGKCITDSVYLWATVTDPDTGETLYQKFELSHEGTAVDQGKLNIDFIKTDGTSVRVGEINQSGLYNSIGGFAVNGVTVIDSSRNLLNVNRIVCSLIPNADKTYDLGSSSTRWRYVYVYNGLRACTQGYSPRTTEDDKYKVIQASGPTSDFIVVLQDGTGRVSCYWNATPYGEDKANNYIIANEPAGKILFSPDSDPFFKIFWAPGVSTVPATVSWQECFSVYQDGSINCKGLKINATLIVDSSRNLLNVNRIVCSLIPNADNTYDLGSSSLRWRIGYFSDVVIVNRGITGYKARLCLSSGQDSDLIITIQDGSGRANIYWDAYYDGTNHIYLRGDDAGACRIKIHGQEGFRFYTAPAGSAGSTIAWTENLHIGHGYIETLTIKPYSDNAYDLGTSTLRWANVYAVNANLSKVLIDDVTVIDSNRNILNVNRIVCSLIPNADATYDLGSSDLKWNKIYGVELTISSTGNLGSLQIGGTTVIDSSRNLLNINRIVCSLIPNADNTYDLGSSSLRWANLYAVNISISTASVSNNLTVGGTANVSELQINGVTVIDSNRNLLNINAVACSLIPNADATYDLGSSSYRWNNIYAVNVYTSDLRLRKGNADWTIFEREDGLYVRNNKTGKIYKILLEEIN